MSRLTLLNSQGKNCSSKSCTQANPQPLTQFWKWSYGKDGLQSHCKECVRENARKQRAKNPEHYRKKAQRSRDAHKHTAAYKTMRRNQKLKECFGITLADYERMYAEQKGICKICGTDSKGVQNGKRLVVDHCHITGRIRGLLCGYCNILLGQAKDSPSILERAIHYLEAAQ